MKELDRLLKTIFRYGVVYALTAALVLVIIFLTNELTTAEANEGLTAILGGATGIIGQALIQAAKDLFNTSDTEENGKP